MKDQPLQYQIRSLIKTIRENPYINEILISNPFPDKKSWYLGAGCICQTVWNSLSNKNPETGIKDYDLIYYDANDISKGTEENEQRRIRDLFIHLPVEIDVVNEARVHVWYERIFGKKINQYKSCEDAINSWPTTATAVAINKIAGKYNVYAPYGLSDLFGMKVKPNKPYVTKSVYEKKVEKWIKTWPNLKIIRWESA